MPARRYRGSHDHDGCTNYEVRKGQGRVTAGCALEKAGMFLAELVEEYYILLVGGAWKEG